MCNQKGGCVTTPATSSLCEAAASCHRNKFLSLCLNLDEIPQNSTRRFNLGTYFSIFHRCMTEFCLIMHYAIYLLLSSFLLIFPNSPNFFFSFFLAPSLHTTKPRLGRGDVLTHPATQIRTDVLRFV